MTVQSISIQHTPLSFNDVNQNGQFDMGQDTLSVNAKTISADESKLFMTTLGLGNQQTIPAQKISNALLTSLTDKAKTDVILHMAQNKPLGVIHGSDLFSLDKSMIMGDSMIVFMQSEEKTDALGDC